MIVGQFISLGKRYAGKYFEVTELEDGVIVMVPMRVIPESEAWLHTPEIKAQLERADAWFSEHSPTETDIDALMQKIGIEP
ncbi:MAG: hypothetical protein U1F76_07320 [Candidatus Competibacteraceae bacterium]